MSAEQVALIPLCAECEAAWLPADEERRVRTCVATILDEPAEVGVSTARSALNGSSTATDSHRRSRTQDAPSRGNSARWRTRARSSSRKRAQSARNSSDTNSPGSSASGSGTGEDSALWLGSRPYSPPRCGNCGNSAVEPQSRRLGPHMARWPTLRRAASGGNDSNGETSSNPRKERKVLRRKSIVHVLAAPFEVGSRGRRRVLRDGPARSTLLLARGRAA